MSAAHADTLFSFKSKHKQHRKRMAQLTQNSIRCLFDCGNYIAVNRRVRELSECIKNILNCVPKMNEGLMGLERHEGE